MICYKSNSIWSSQVLWFIYSNSNFVTKIKITAKSDNSTNVSSDQLYYTSNHVETYLTIIRDSSIQNEVVVHISISRTILVILPPKCACWKLSIFSVVPVGINLDGMTCSHIMHLSTIWSGKRWAHAIISLTRYYYNNNILS